jgi:hypothetical protein
VAGSSSRFEPCGSPLLQQGELDFSPAKKRTPTKSALAAGF